MKQDYGKRYKEIVDHNTYIVISGLKEVTKVAF